MPLYLRESDVEKLLPPEDAVEAVEGCFRRLGSGQAENRPRYRIPLNEGRLNILGAADRELGVAGLKSYVTFAPGARFVVVLFAADSPEVLALIEADRLGQLRTGEQARSPPVTWPSRAPAAWASSEPAGRRSPARVHPRARCRGSSASSRTRANDGSG